jgi:23S rRNA (pseudouridine1915-N3)-methyltransferase
VTAGVAVLWVGRRPEAAWQQLAAEYARRIARFTAFAEHRLRPSAARTGAPGRALAQEAAAIARHLEPGDVTVVLDEQGPTPSTAELAVWLGRQRALGRRAVFVVGSDLGLDDAFKARAHERLALSRLTLPHALARVLLLEQLYRCLDLLAGGAYHRGESVDWRV